MSSPASPGQIRSASGADRPPIMDVAHACGLFAAEELADVSAALDAFLSGDTPDEHWLVNDSAAGATAIAYYAPERMTRGTWNLLLLAVHPDRQHRSRGTALVPHVEQDLQRLAARVLLIETSGVPEFAAPRELYASLGYAEEAHIWEFYAPGDDKVVFWKHL